MARSTGWVKTIGDNVVRLGLVALAVLLVANLVRSVEANYAVTRQIRTLQGQIATEKARSTLVADANVYYQTATYKELEGRQRLGLVLPGEKLVLVPENRDPTSATPTSAAAPSATNTARAAWDQRPPYQQWWLLFFGPSSLLEQTFGS